MEYTTYSCIINIYIPEAAIGRYYARRRLLQAEKRFDA